MKMQNFLIIFNKQLIRTNWEKAIISDFKSQKEQSILFEILLSKAFWLPFHFTNVLFMWIQFALCALFSFPTATPTVKNKTKIFNYKSTRLFLSNH